MFSMYGIGSNIVFVVCFSGGGSIPSLQPGGELAIITFAGKDATEEFNMLLKPEWAAPYCLPPKNELVKS